MGRTKITLMAFIANFRYAYFSVCIFLRVIGALEFCSIYLGHASLNKSRGLAAGFKYLVLIHGETLAKACGGRRRSPTKYARKVKQQGMGPVEKGR